MKITCYGGVGEIGGNKVLLEAAGRRLMLDFGISYDQKGRYFEEYLQPRSQSALHDYLELGILPEIDGIYREDAFSPAAESNLGRSEPFWESGLTSFREYRETHGTSFLDALLITHGHDDHHSLSAFLGPTPTYCSKETETLMEVSQKIGNYSGYEGELTYLQRRSLGQYGGGYFPGEDKVEKGEKKERPFNTFEGNFSFQLGKGGGVSVQAIPVGHSVPGAVAYYVEAEGKSLLYTGDIRFHGRYLSKSEVHQEMARLDPDFLLIEGTRIGDEERDDEKKVRRQLGEEISAASGLAMVGFRWKDVERFETVREAATESGRTLVISARLAYLLHQLGHDVKDMNNVRVFLERRNGMIYSPGDYTRDKYKAGYSEDWKSGGGPDKSHLKSGVDALQLRENQDQFVLQLTYWQFNNLLDLTPTDDSVFIRASTEPFNQEMELSEERLQNWLEHFGVNPPDNRPKYIHASGHASGTELLELTRLLEPETVIPIHTENPKVYSEEIESPAVVMPTPGATIDLAS